MIDKRYHDRVDAVYNTFVFEGDSGHRRRIRTSRLGIPVKVRPSMARC